MPKGAGEVTLVCSGNRLLVSPTTDAIYSLLAPVLTYDQAEFSTKHAGPSFESTEVECFMLDYANRIATMFGFFERIANTLEKAGYTVNVRHMPRANADPKLFEPNFDNVLEFAELRYRQSELLATLASYDNGQFNAPPGFGKSKTVLFICAMFPKAKILVTADPVVVVRDMLYTELAGALPRVGIVGGGKHIMRDRIMCATFDSLHHIDPQWPDIVLVDENHQAGAPGISSKLAQFTDARMYGLSATTECRPDGSDLITEGLFGPVRFFMSYAEALQHGLVGQIEIHWESVFMSRNPCAFIDDIVERDRIGIWRNTVRNKKIAKDAMAVGDDEAVLVTCRTTEHLANILAACPKATLLYAEDTSSVSAMSIYSNIIPEQPLMTSERREQLVNELQNGKPGIYVSTPILNTGFNATKLRFLIRADGSSGETLSTQIPGRVSRRNDHKSGGFVRDYMDDFDSTLHGRFKRRRATYTKHGWPQIYPGDKTSILGTLKPGCWQRAVQK